MKKLVLIDGNALLHRAYHITPPLTTSKGELVNAIYGFSAMLLKVLADLKPDYLAVAWDMKAPTFRHTQFEKYKANRGPSDDALSSQYERVFQVLKAFNIPSFKLPGFEADDLVGTLATKAQRQKNLKVLIITGDRDLMQLINSKVKVIMPKKTLLDVGTYGEEEFAARFGFAPKNLVDFKALAGDTSDNIPGVPGIGEVGATKLVQEYETFENIYKNIDKLPEKMRSILEKGKESGQMSKKLATIETEIPIKLDLKACQVHDFNRTDVINLFTELEFKSLINRIPGSSVIASETKQSLRNDNELSPRSKEPGFEFLPKGNKLTMDLDSKVDRVLKKMSETGVLVDLKFLNELGEKLKSKLVTLEKEIYSIVGHEFNLNSPKQLQVILFDELGLPVLKKTKTGRSTDEETLQSLYEAHPIIPKFLQYRQLYKLVSTYIDALPKYVASDHRIHSTFNVEGAATGRLSSINPNLQNIPIKGEMGGEMRKAFIAPKGKVLLGADYSQIELRILAHLANDPGLKKAFQEDIDIHSLTASKIFKVPVSEVSKQQRMVGKTMNFATLYGQGPHALSRQLGVDYKTAQDYITEYFAQFPKVKDWMAKVVEEGYKQGYVETIWGRKRYIPELQAQNRMLRAFGERAAVNHPIQGTSADMIKKAMVEIDKELMANSKLLIAKSQKPQAISCGLILQVHDELLFECDGLASSPQVQKVAKMVKEKMENSLKLSVPVKVELKSGQNWGEMSPLKA